MTNQQFSLAFSVREGRTLNTPIINHNSVLLQILHDNKTNYEELQLNAGVFRLSSIRFKQHLNSPCNSIPGVDSGISAIDIVERNVQSSSREPNQGLLPNISSV
jgi:hypothetical protein